MLGTKLSHFMDFKNIYNPYKIHPFKVYNSVVFSIFSFVTITINSRTFSWPQRETLHLLEVTLHPEPHSSAPAITNLLCFSVFAYCDISHIWNYTMCGLLYLASLILHNILKVDPCCRVCQDFIPYYVGIIVHCPWLLWFSGLRAGLQTKRLLVWFLVRAHAWVVAQVPSRGHTRGNHTLMFLSLFPLPSPLSKKK